jgi:endoglucanase
MRRLSLSLLILCCPLTAQAALTLAEVRTASNTVIEVYFTSTTINATEVSTADLTQWTVNGTAVTAINKYVMQADSCDHHIFLTVPPLVSGTTYQLQTPHGSATLAFDDHKTLCESIKVNQSAYSALSKSNYAYLAIWLGDGGAKQISGTLPTYEVFETLTGNVVATGSLTEVGTDASSGDFLYKIDLSKVPEGGPYRVSVKGYGASYPFGVGGDFSRRLAYTIMRGQYYQRCGCPIHSPYGWDIRTNPCHTTIYDTNSPAAETIAAPSGTEPTLFIVGGYHDAGDTDRRVYHISNPVVNLMVYEAFPEMFSDGQFDIPDKFDDKYNIVGQGNGVPDIIDEAEWGTLIWEMLQKSDGSIYYGTNCSGYADGAPYDTADKKKYGTMAPDDRGPAVAAGLFLHLARLLKPYNAARADKLATEAQLAFSYISGKTWANPEKLYYYIQKYLYDGDAAAHTQVQALASTVDNYKSNAFAVPGYSLNNSSFDNPGYVVSYMVEKTRPTDPAVITRFTNAIKGAADANIAQLKAHAYPVGNSGGGWGHNVQQGIFAAASLLYWRFSQDQSYFDAAASLLNYTLGLNPIGISYVTGLGFHQVHNPHDRQSWYTKRQATWGVPVPGITVFGPGSTGSSTTFPAIGTLPAERQYADNQGDIQKNEFTIFETMTHSALYTVLAGGGKWDPTKDPFVSGAGAGADGGAAGAGGRGGATGAGGAGGSGGTTSAGGVGGSGGRTTAAGGSTASGGGATAVASGGRTTAGGAGGGATVASGGATAAAGGTTTTAGGTTVASGGTTAAAGGSTTAAGGTTVSSGGMTTATGGSSVVESGGATSGGGGGSASTGVAKASTAGCSCSTPGHARGSGRSCAWMLVLLGLVAVIRRRRRW